MFPSANSYSARVEFWKDDGPFGGADDQPLRSVDVISDSQNSYFFLIIDQNLPLSLRGMPK